jgi:hypothetical protein
MTYSKKQTNIFDIIFKRRRNITVLSRVERSGVNIFNFLYKNRIKYNVNIYYILSTRSTGDWPVRTQVGMYKASQILALPLHSYPKSMHCTIVQRTYTLHQAREEKRIKNQTKSTLTGR